MDASSIPYKLSLCADRAHACAGDSYVSSGIDVACPTTQNVFAIASPHELQGDSWPSSSTGTSSFCCNQQYSVTAITTAAGAIAERYAYTAYGLPTILDASASVLSSSAISNRYTYTGREWDATLALHHFRARWMSPIAGRFLGRDPIGYLGSEWHFNEVFESNPMVNLDPEGKACIVYLRCFNVGQVRLDWRTVRCSYECTIDESRGGLPGSGDPPGTRTVGAGGIDCHDPRLSSQVHTKTRTHTDFVGTCNCLKDWFTQSAYDEWTNPVTDCVRQECLDETARRLEALRLACNALQGPAKVACQALLTSQAELLRSICNQCLN